ncbi:MAG: nuclear transport factor 2 family protein [Leptolyngbya sp. SIO1D8]|nr:nuclear transport factor 2 family protein [Leptolyngbya sp. SIO1D8]
MSNQELAQKLHKAIVDTDLATIHNELFSKDVESIESQFPLMPHAKGIDQVKEKANLFGGNIGELHSKSVSDEVVVSGDYISMGMSFDATLKDGNRMQISEIVVYRVNDGKIISEQFFY